MNFTLFGYPKAGKTTLFNILTGARAEVTAYEDGRREPNERMCPLPDARLNGLGGLYPEKKKVAASLDFIDLAGISYGEVKTSVFLNALRKADGLIHVVRGFHDDQIPQAKPALAPKDDIRTMEEELLLADLISIEARLERLEKDLKKAKNPEGEKERDLISRLHQHLGDGRPLREFALTEPEEKQLKAFAFLSQKPILHVINADESDIGRLHDLERDHAPGRKGAAVLAFCGKIEEEILEIENEEDKRVFREEYGLSEPTPGRFFPAALGLMETIFFYTVGKDEVRAWPIRSHSTALRAAGAIHSDIEKGFIRAEVIPYEVLLPLGSLHAAKEKGVNRLEGKEYIVRDGDVIYFRFAP